jgi:tRNA nucleotidyltransferase/poly(A) polymerase
MGVLMNDVRLTGIFRTLTAGGFDAYVVGGAVRDMVMGKIPQDIDVVTNAGIEDIRGLFKTQAVQSFGQSFEICLVDGIQISPCRAKKDFPAADLGRRDFTFNSMAWHPFSDTILDLFSGRKDLENKVVRFTGNADGRIAEDPLRMVRACRFATAIQGRLSAGTAEAVARHAPLLKTGVAAERIRMEILKAMVCDRPSLFFETLHQTGLLNHIFPSLEQCVDFDGGPHHGETVFEHCMITGDALSKRNPLLRLAGFLHDVGKVTAAVWDQGEVAFAGHEKFTDRVAQELARLRFSASDIQYIISLIHVHMRPLKSDTTPRAARRILAMLKAHDISYQDFLRMRIADKKGNLAKQPYTFSQIRERLEILLRELKPDRAFQTRDLDISGNDIMQLLGINSGPLVGKILNALLEQVIDRPELNTRPRLEAWILHEYQTKEAMTVENSSK